MEIKKTGNTVHAYMYTVHMALNEHVQCNVILDCIELKMMSLHILYYLLDPIWAHIKSKVNQSINFV